MEDPQPGFEAAPGWETREASGAPLPPSGRERDLLPIPGLSLPKARSGCRRTRQAGQRERRTAELVNEAISALNQMAGFDGPLDRRQLHSHFGSMDAMGNKHAGIVQ